jgi:hypothetical protein
MNQKEIIGNNITSEETAAQNVIKWTRNGEGALRSIYPFACLIFYETDFD